MKSRSAMPKRNLQWTGSVVFLGQVMYDAIRLEVDPDASPQNRQEKRER